MKGVRDLICRARPAVADGAQEEDENGCQKENCQEARDAQSGQTCRTCPEISCTVEFLLSLQAFDIKPQVQQAGYDTRLKPQRVHFPVL